MATGFLIEPGTSAEQLAARRQLAQALLKEGGSGAPIGSWTQGLNKLAQGLLGGYDLYQIGQEEKTEKLQGQQLINEALGLPSSVAQPSTPGKTASALVGPMPSIGGSVTDRIINVESGGNATATNPRSSATGAGQFINSTWLDMLKRNRPDLVAGKSDADILALRNDPNISRQMVDAYAAENAVALTRAGIEPNDRNTYLAHFAGPAGAVAILKANPATPAGQVLGANAVQANPFLANMTAGDLVSWADRKMGSGAAASAGLSAMPTSAPATASPLGITPERAAVIGKLSMNKHTAPLAQKLLADALTPKQAQTGRFKYEKGLGVLDSVTGQIVRPDSPESSREKPPSGYRWGADGQALEAIPGGPATVIPGDQAGRLAAMQTAKSGFADAKKYFEGMDWGRVNKVLNRGDAGRAERTIRLAVESALRAMTGAAAPSSEVDQYMELFGPSAWDTQATITDKLTRLESFIGNAERNLQQGRGPLPSQIQQSTPRTDKAPGYKILKVE